LKIKRHLLSESIIKDARDSRIRFRKLTLKVSFEEPGFSDT